MGDIEDDSAEIRIDEETRKLLRTKDFYVNQGSVFTPNARIRINFVPIILSVVLPWMLFTVMLTISLFRWRHDHATLNECVWWWVVGLLAVGFASQFYREHHDVQARWTRANCIFVTIALLVALCASFFVYRLYFRRYYDTIDLKTYPMVDVSTTNGRDVMDAGMLYFSQGTQIDFTRSWHFKHGSLFCVAPLVKRDTAGNVLTPRTGSLDFFVVGKDCCSVSSSDYRCPGYDSPNARAGIRILHGDKLQFWRLAVEQGETKYGYISTYPIFVEWVEDPVYSMEDLKSRGMAIYFILIFASLLFQMFCVCCCTMRMSLIGRTKKSALEAAGVNLT